MIKKLNCVKQFQYSAVMQKFNIIHIICENFRTIPLILCKYSLFDLKGSKIESHKIWNLGTNLCFSEVNLISYVMLNNKESVIWNKTCMKFTVGQTP